MTVGLKVDPPQRNGATKNQQRHASFYKAGTTVTGRVYLSVTKPNITARSIQLQLVGKENLVVHHTSQVEERHRDGRSHTHHQDHYEHSTHDVVNLDYPLHIFSDGRIPRGQYEFPFALDLPDTLPSTLTKISKGESSCELSYVLKVEVYQQPNSLLHNNVNAQQTLDIAAVTSTTRRHDTSLHLPVQEIPVTKCCCCRSIGYMALECQVGATTIRPGPGGNTTTTNNNHHHNGEGLSVAWRARNESTARVETIRVELTEVVEWTSRGRSEKVKTILASTRLDAGRFPELDKLKKRAQRRQRTRNRHDGYEPPDERVLEHLPWHECGPLVVPYRTNDTYQGRGIQIRHVLSVRLHTDGCCATNPEASTLMLVYKSLEEGEDHDRYGPTVLSENAAYHPYGLTLDDCPPSAPPMEEEVEDHMGFAVPTVAASTVTPSAPTDLYDYGAYTSSSTSSVAIVEAHALPTDWNAQTAEVVHIPMAEAIVLEPSMNAAVSSAPPGHK